MNGQTEASEALGKHLQNPAGVSFHLAANDKVISKAYQEAAPLHPGFDPLYKPPIHYMMEEYVGEHR